MRSVAERPLEGRRIVVTRPREQAAALAETLRGLGAEVVVVPLIEIEAAVGAAESAKLWMSDLHRFDWLVLTSANGVTTLSELPGAAWLLRNVRVAVVGPATAAAIRKLGVEPAFVPERFAAEEIAAGLDDLQGTKVLMVQSDIASDRLAQELRTRGARVDVIHTYRTIVADPPEDEVAEIERGVDAMVLASGSAARSLARLSKSVPQVGDALLVCIGPRTAAVARKVGLTVGLVADEATADGIIRALVSHFGEQTE